MPRSPNAYGWKKSCASGRTSSTSVRDSGKGLEPESLEHLFDAFFTTKPDGIGMGLAICRSIIESQGGKLWGSPNSPRAQFSVYAAVRC